MCNEVEFEAKYECENENSMAHEKTLTQLECDKQDCLLQHKCLNKLDHQNVSEFENKIEAHDLVTANEFLSSNDPTRNVVPDCTQHLHPDASPLSSQVTDVTPETITQCITTQPILSSEAHVSQHEVHSMSTCPLAPVQHSSLSSQCLTSTSSPAYFSQETYDINSVEEDEVYNTEFASEEIETKSHSIDSKFKEFNDLLRSDHNSSYYPEDTIKVKCNDYFVDPLHQSENDSGYNDDLNTNSENNSWQVKNIETDIYFSDQDDDCTDDEIYESDTEEEISESDSPPAAPPDPQVNKTTLQYKSQLNYDRFHIPSVDPQVDHYQDKRSFLQVASDCIRILEGKMTKEEIDFLNDSCGFDVSSPSYHKNGFAKLKSELLDEMKAYKKYNNLTKSETQQVDDIIKKTTQAKGQLPKKVVRTGFSPGPTKDYIDNKSRRT